MPLFRTASAFLDEARSEIVQNVEKRNRWHDGSQDSFRKDLEEHGFRNVAEQCGYLLLGGPALFELSDAAFRAVQWSHEHAAYRDLRTVTGFFFL